MSGQNSWNSNQSVELGNVNNSDVPQLQDNSVQTGCPKWCKNVTLGVALLIMLGLLVAGFIAPWAVDKIQKDTLRDKLPVNVASMNTEDYNKYVNKSLKSDWYVFNLTNLKDVLQNGAKPNFQAVGPVKTTKYTYKVDLDYSNPNVVKYKTATTFLVDPESEKLLDQSVVTINTLYVGGMAAIGRGSPSPSKPNIPVPSQLSEELFNTYVVGAQFLPGIRETVLDSKKSALLAGFRLLAIPVYFQAVQTQLAAAGITAAQVITHWATAATPAYSNVNPVFVDFELSTSLSNPSVQATNLWAPANDVAAYSLKSGMTTWMAALQTMDSKVIGAICQAMQLTQADFMVIAQWIGKLTAWDHKGYETIVTGAIRAMMATTRFNTDDYLPYSWSQLGATQFGTGIITSLLIDQAKGTTYASSGIGTSACDVLGAAAGLGATVGDVEPIEFRSGIMYVGTDKTGFNPINTPALPIMNVTSLLSTVGNSATAPLPYGALRQGLAGVIQASQALCTAFGKEPCATAVEYVLSQDTTGQLRMVFAAAGVNSDGSNVKAFHYYLTTYLGSLLTGFVDKLGADGIGAPNSGLFTRQKIGDVLFGSTGVAKLGDTPQIAGDRHIYGKEAQYIAAAQSTMIGREYMIRTGRDDLRYINQYVKYEGVDSFSTQCELKDPAYRYICNGTANTLANNWKIFGQPEVIAGACDGTEIQPFLEGSNNIQPEVNVYISDVRRVASFLYTGDVTIKGINLRRYRLNPALLNSSIGVQPNPYRDEARYQTASAPTGMISVRTALGGVPFFASQPMMMGVDPNVQSRINGLKVDFESMISQVDIEPLTGITMHAQKRLQVNMRIRASELNAVNQHYTKMFATPADEYYVPFYYGDEYDIIKDDDADSFKKQIYKMREIAEILRPVLTIVGGIGAILCGVLLYRLNKAEQ